MSSRSPVTIRRRQNKKKKKKEKNLDSIVAWVIQGLESSALRALEYHWPGTWMRNRGSVALGFVPEAGTGGIS